MKKGIEGLRRALCEESAFSVELEEEAESLVRGQYDVLETKEGSIVVIGDY